MLSSEQLQLIKLIREETNISLSKCKEALEATNYNAAKARDYIKNHMKDQVIYRDGRSTSQGRFFISTEATKASLIELKTETDFVSRQKLFIDLGEELSSNMLRADDKSLVEDRIKATMLKLGENIVIGRTQIFTAPVIGSYIHQGKIACIVTLNKGDEETARQIAIHVISESPICLSKEDSIFKEYFSDIESEARKTYQNKPQNIQDRIVSGMEDKHASENCLVLQKFYANKDISVQEYLDNNNSEIKDFTVWSFQETTS